MKQQKLDLKKLQVQSFVTNLSESTLVIGGSRCTGCRVDCDPCTDICNPTNGCGTGGGGGTGARITCLVPCD